jgi:hypothetical protein
MSLTKEQECIFNTLYEFSVSKTLYNMILLNASAGTGKTYLLSCLIKKLLQNENIKKIEFACPTHVSLNIAKTKILNQINTISDKLNITTIHSLLKYTQNIQHDGTIEYTRNYNKKISLECDLIIVDECSMIDNLMYLDLKNICKKNNIKIIFNGDEYQLPPIGIEKSLIFTLDLKTITLNEMVRSKSQNITNFVYKHRECITKNIPIKIGKMINNNDICLIKNKQDFINAFIKDLNENNILLAYHVKVVEEYNKKIREIIFNKKILNYYENGEYLIFNEHHKIKTLNDNDEDEIIVFNTSEKVKVNSINIKTEKIKKNIITLTKTLTPEINKIICDELEKINNIIEKTQYEIYYLSVYKLTDLSKQYLIKTISNKHYSIFNNFLNVSLKHLKKIYDDSSKIIDNIATEDNNKNVMEANLNIKMKKIYNNFYDIIFEYAKLNYGYSMTVHKSQSATFDNVYIDIDDIHKNKNETEMKKMLFTAITRASYKLILHSNF